MTNFTLSKTPLKGFFSRAKSAMGALGKKKCDIRNEKLNGRIRRQIEEIE